MKNSIVISRQLLSAAASGDFVDTLCEGLETRLGGPVNVEVDTGLIERESGRHATYLWAVAWARRNPLGQICFLDIEEIPPRRGW